MTENDEDHRVQLLIFGTGSQASTAINIARLLAKVVLVGLIDLVNEDQAGDRQIDGLHVLGGLGKLASLGEVRNLHAIVAIGDRNRKANAVERITEAGLNFLSIVHPNACVAPTAKIGIGTIVSAGVTIEPNSRIGDHVVVRSGSTLSHDVFIGDFASIGPGVTIAGRARIGAGSTIHTGSTVIPNIEIGEKSVVGAGSLVVKNVEAGTMVAGSPARRTRPVN